jgi:hypothetical protein
MKKFLKVVSVFVLVFLLLTACSNNSSQSEAPQESSDEIDTQVSTQEETEKVTEKATEKVTEKVTEAATEELTEQPTEEETKELLETEKNVTNAALAIEAEDATFYNTKDNAVPLGQWVYYQAKNFTSGEYEPFYIRIIGVSRDPAEVQAELDSYSGNWDLSLKPDQARDIEYGIVEYEIYFAPDYAASEFGISIPTMSWGAEALETVGFKTDGGTSYIGVGRTYNLNSSERQKPGDIVSQKDLFSILKNYDEEEYVFNIDWYDGEITTENARELYLAVTK